MNCAPLNGEANYPSALVEFDRFIYINRNGTGKKVKILSETKRDLNYIKTDESEVVYLS